MPGFSFFNVAFTLLFGHVFTSGWLGVSGLIQKDGNITCPNKNSTKYATTVCPSTSLGCCKIEYASSGYGCAMQAVDDPNLVYCCMPGPEKAGSNDVRNVMVLGDSVSIGYTPYVVDFFGNLGSTGAQVQHSPWDTRNGGACNTSYGLSCFDIFMVSVSRDYIKWDAIQFNFGLHDTSNSSNAITNYTNQLTQFTNKLLNYTNNEALLQYALTTPDITTYTQGNYVIEKLNIIAQGIMASFKIPTVELYNPIINYCGPLPFEDCSICATTPCQVHYNSYGYKVLSLPVIEMFLQRLNISHTKSNYILVE